MPTSKRILLFCFLLVSINGFAQQRVTWLTDDRGDLPHYLSVSPYSIGMDTTNLVLSLLSGFEFEFGYASVARFDAQLSNTPNTCVANRVKKPDREKKHLFSLPLNLHPNARLYFRKSQITIPTGLFNEKGELSSIRAIMDANPGSRIAIIKGVSFGPGLDTLLAELSTEQVSYYSVDNRYESGPKLLRDGLVDFSLSYPSEMTSFVNDDADSVQYDSRPLKLKQQFVISHIACSRSTLGKKIINKINQILMRNYKQDAFIQAHLRHIPSQDHDDFRAFYHATLADYLQKTLSVAVDSFPPYVVLKEGEPPRGLDITIGEKIAQKMGVQLKYSPCPFARCIRMLELGSVDLYVSLFRSPQREEWMHFVEPAIANEAPQAFYISHGSELNVERYEDLTNLVVGVLRDSEYFKRFDADDSLTKVAVVSNQMLVDMLLKGRVDVFIGSQTVIDHLLEKSGVSTLIKKAPYRHPGERSVYVALSKRSVNVHLLEDLSLAVKSLKEQGVFSEIYNTASDK